MITKKYVMLIQNNKSSSSIFQPHKLQTKKCPKIWQIKNIVYN